MLNGIKAETVSVAICTYNGARYLREQLESIRQQSRTADELVVCDDASQDETVQILREFSAESGIKIRIYVNSANLGFTRNFEQALRLCDGDLVFIADQDDIWYPKKIEAVCRLCRDNPGVLGITHDGRLVDEQGQWHGTLKREQIFRGYGRDKHAITGALSCIRRTALVWVLPIPDGIQGHDIWMSYVFSWFPDLWLFSDLCLEDIRRHASNTSDWVVNSFRPINKVDVIKAQMQTGIATDYSDRQLMNETLLARLHDMEGGWPGLGSGRVTDAIQRLQEERKAIHQRQAIADQPDRLRRWWMALHLLALGGYSHFNGLRSFTRDLAR